MRVRRVMAEWQNGKAELDFRNDGGIPLPIIGISGPNGAGKSLLQLLALRCFKNSMSPNTVFLDWDDVSGSVEFEYGGAIATAMVHKGKIIQNLVFPHMTVDSMRMQGGVLGYSRHRFTWEFARWGDTKDIGLGEKGISSILHDLYKGDIRNSIIWVDDFDIGLDTVNASKFLQHLIKKSLEKSNQLIVSTMSVSALGGMGEDSKRVLSDSRRVDIVDKALKGLNL